MKIATWNVNSIKARKDRLLAWLAKHSPDVLCLQELKVDDAGFPGDEIAQTGYQVILHGQKSYNGVAILSRALASDVQIGLGDDTDDPQARLISATLHGVRVISVYAPNGGEPSSEKFVYKLAWLDRLLAHLDRTYDPSKPLIVCGDLNIAPEDRDVARPEEWNDSVLCRPEVRAAFQRLLGWGLRDCFRTQHQEPGLYSWWDYRQLGFPKNNGLRIDHILATPAVAERCTAAHIDREQRKGKLPSDHAPVLAQFDLASLGAE
jgi:exodeoxyribonuclease-3